MRLLLVRAAAVSFAACVSASPVLAADIYTKGSGGSFKDGPVAVASSSFYVSIRGGATFAQDTDFDVLGLNVENEYEDVGFMVSGAFGKSFAGWGGGMGGLRGEIEIGYLRNDIDAHDVEVLGRFSGSDAFGETSAVFGLVNLYYDFNPLGRFKPFVGAGIGVAKVDFDGHGVSAVGVVMDDSDTAFAFQLSAGTHISLSESVDLELGYRFLGLHGAELEAVDGTSSDVDVNNHIIYGGLRFKM
jgi:opacity protein-like surface antigen